MMISNQYQEQTNFRGNLLKEGIKLPQKKFEEAAKIYAQKTKGMPDLTLVGRLNNSDFDGQFFHSTHAIMNGEDIASIVTKSLKSMFENCSPKEIATELADITKMFEGRKKVDALIKEIEDLQGKITYAKYKIKHTPDSLAANRLQIIADRMGATLAKKEAQLQKLQMSVKNISTEWCI